MLADEWIDYFSIVSSLYALRADSAICSRLDVKMHSKCNLHVLCSKDQLCIFIFYRQTQ
jgi:hypothetical protein